MTWFIGLFDTVSDYTLECPQPRLHCRCLVTAFNSERSPSSPFPNCPRPQLPASNSNTSQRLNLSTRLTNSVTHQQTNSPTSWLTNSNKFKVNFMLHRRSVGRSLLVSSTRLKPKPRFLLLSHSCEFVDLGRPLWREDGPVVYNCCCPSPTQSFSGPSPVGLMIVFYCLRFETPPTWRARSPYLYHPVTGWSRSPGTGFPFRRLLRLAGLRWRYSDRPPRWVRDGPHRKHRFHYCCAIVSVETYLFAKPLLSNCRCVFFISRSLPSNGFTCHNIYINISLQIGISQHVSMLISF
jgi:hypothetical protein